jgi:hypothetical protein
MTWQEYQHAIADLFRLAANAEVEEDITVAGKSGVDRQLDAQVTLTVRVRIRGQRTFLLLCRRLLVQGSRNIRWHALFGLFLPAVLLDRDQEECPLLPRQGSMRRQDLARRLALQPRWPGDSVRLGFVARIRCISLRAECFVAREWVIPRAE